MLEALPLGERIVTIQQAIDRPIPEAERAGVASRVFGDRAGVIIRRLDSDVIRQAAQDVEDFGVAVSDVDADRIEVANDALSWLGLVWTGLGNRLAAAAAPGLQALAEAAKRTGPLGEAIDRRRDAALGRGGGGRGRRRRRGRAADHRRAGGR